MLVLVFVFVAVHVEAGDRNKPGGISEPRQEEPNG